MAKRRLPRDVVTALSKGWTQRQFDQHYAGAVVTRDIGGIWHEVWLPEDAVWVRDSEFRIG